MNVKSSNLEDIEGILKNFYSREDFVLLESILILKIQLLLFKLKRFKVDSAVSM